MANRYTKKMFNIINHQGNASQNHNEISPHTSQDGYYQENKGQQARMWRNWDPLHC